MGSITSLFTGENQSKELISLIEQLLACDKISPFFTMLLSNFKNKIANASIIDSSLIQDIVSIYTLRWSEVIDTQNDYMRSIEGVNKAWFSLAKKLAEMGLIPSNYYKLLIPTLNDDYDKITNEELTARPLSHYILAEQDNELILLENCINHHKHYHTFNNCNQHPSKALTTKEIQRLRYADPHFSNYYQSIEIPHDLPVYKSTIDAVKRLVNKSIFQEGLLSNRYYTNDHQVSADEAYKTFLSFREKLPEEERTNLDGQLIVLDGQQYTFLEILEIICDKGECLATYGLFFLKLVIDYQSDAVFHNHPDLNKFINCSAKKIYRSVTAEEALRRIKMLFVSLMTYRFDYLWGTGRAVQLWDCANTTTHTGKEIFDTLQPLICLETIESPEKIYHSLINTIIEPALLNEGIVPKLTRSSTTIKWLQSIVDDSMFEIDNQMAFEPEQLFILFSSMLEKYPTLTEPIESFLQELLKTLMQDRSYSLQWVRVNIKFFEHLGLYETDQQQEILGVLRKNPNPVSSSLLLQHLNTFISNQLIQDRHKNKKTTIRFFHEIHKNSSFNDVISQGLMSHSERLTIRRCLDFLCKSDEKIPLSSSELSIHLDQLKTSIPDINPYEYFSSFLRVVR